MSGTLTPLSILTVVMLGGGIALVLTQGPALTMVGVLLVIFSAMVFLVDVKGHIVDWDEDRGDGAGKIADRRGEAK